MAQRLRKRQRVSYTEPSDDDDVVDAYLATPMANSTSSGRLQPSSRNLETPTRPLTRSRTETALTGHGTKLEKENFDAETSFRPEKSHLSKKRKRKSPSIAIRTRPASIKQGVSRIHSSKPKKSKRMELDQLKPPQDKGNSNMTGFQLAEFPYEIRVEIFKLAAYPLIDKKTLRATDGVKWLINMATMCKSFKEPALTALYEDPPISGSRAKPHLLADLLVKDPNETAVDYRAKIRYLHLDAKQHLILSAPGRGRFQLPSLTGPLTNLTGLHVDYLRTMVNTTGLGVVLERWVQPALDELKSTLKEFTLDIDLINRAGFFNFMLWAEGARALGSLEELVIHNANAHVLLRRDPETEPPERQVHVEILRDFIRQQPKLKSLRFVDSALIWYPNSVHHDINGKLLTQYEKNLTSVEFSSCTDLSTPHLNQFLMDNGRTLESLELYHNKELGLGFIQGLDRYCPKLKKFSIDLFEYRGDHMIGSPDWIDSSGLDWTVAFPPAIRSIAMVNLKGVTTISAINLFQSFLDRRSQMPNLRELVLHMNCTELTPRERAQFKRDWVENKMRHSFLSRAEPRQELRSVAGFYAWKEQQFLRGPLEEMGEMLSKRKLRPMTAVNGQPAAANDDQAEGTCTRVDITVHGLRPARHQYTERDFLSEGEDDDGDWNGQDIDDDGYAW
ncbi:hypothetical protein P152DRAFT_459844 [Eremomyces bilateralis CBS 781.70]|uniref:Uncharacterized protein n=1 Tax=Eremomyces bilateralis CBS 781.70 TaxID=1392243 RepID=A0A6G1FYV9_9PEZI|nr:uncharacterized protein P152DRAFT_459844 [Eremomyces bilateralis CBS 781.70]KAF1810973.1 hypothetical protein P152DRAFT_459844 [Eremomyces bilateralis CBS 781.70]